MADYVIIYNTTTGRLQANLAGASQLVDGAITSAKLASGQVGSLHVAPAAIISSLIASGAIGRSHILAGEIVSANIGALAIGAGHLAWGAVVSGKIAALGIQAADINWGQVASGKYAAGSIMNADIGNAQIISSKIASGHVGSLHIAPAAIASGLVAGRAILSGNIASGTITETELVSGISIDIAEYLKEPSYTSKAAISGCSCVYLASGQLIDTALPISGYLPAIGIIGDAVAAATLTPIFFAGRFTHGLLSGICSGYWGQRVFLAASGQISRTPPSASGQCVQAIGEIADNNSIFVYPEPTFIELAQ